jgi:AAA domain
MSAPPTPQELAAFWEDVGVPEPPADACWEPCSILAGVDLDSPPPAPELLGLVYRGKFHLVSGAPEAAKTWFALVVIVEAVRAGGVAIILDTDGGGQLDLARRLEALGLDRELIELSVRYSDNPAEWFGTDEARDRVTAWIKAQSGDAHVIALIDTINPTIAALGHKLDEGGMAAMEAAVIAPLKRAGATVIGPDHVAIHAPKDSPYSISTQRKHAASDVHLRLTETGTALQQDGPPATFVITGPKDRPGGIERRGQAKHVGKITFTPAHDGRVAYSVDLSPPSAQEERAVFRPTLLMERVSAWAAVQVEPFSKKMVEEDVRGKGPHLRLAVDRLLSEGYLVADGDRYRHVRNYRQADDPEASDTYENDGDDPGGSSRGSSPGRGTGKGAGGSSPRPSSNHAGSQGSSHPKGRGRPDAVGRGSSPSSPPTGGTGDDPTGDESELLLPTDDYAERFRREHEPLFAPPPPPRRDPHGGPA